MIFYPVMIKPQVEHGVPDRTGQGNEPLSIGQVLEVSVAIRQRPRDVLNRADARFASANPGVPQSLLGRFVPGILPRDSIHGLKI